MIPQVLTIVGVPILRSVFGFLENAMSEDSDEGTKISNFEIKQLVTTVLRLGVPSLALFYGFNLDVGLAAAIPLVVDYLYGYIKKLKK